MALGNTRLARRLLWIAGYVNVVLLCIMCSTTSMHNGGTGWSLFLGLTVDALVGWYAIRQGIVFELGRERIWNAVCQGLGNNFTSRRLTFHMNPLTVLGGSLMRPAEERKYPKLRDVAGTRDSWSATVIPFAGQTVADYNAHAEAFAQAFRVPLVQFSLSETGGFVIQAGDVRLPAAYNHPGVAAHLPERSLPALPSPRELLRAVPVARDIDDEPWYMPVEGQHILIAARTGGGKSSYIWSLVLSLAPAIKAGLVVLWGVDPKRLELAIGRNWWHHYADNDTAIVELLERCVADMLARVANLQGRSRKFVPSPDDPLNIIVIDELGYLSSLMPDKKLRDRANSALQTLLIMGRAPGYCVVGAVQDPRKESVNARDLFSIRIAGGLPAAMVDLVLDEGAHDAGALCEQIPLSEAGVAYVISETDRKPLLIRSAWCDDLTIQQALLSSPVEPHVPPAEQPQRQLSFELEAPVMTPPQNSRSTRSRLEKL